MEGGVCFVFTLQHVSRSPMHPSPIIEKVAKATRYTSVWANADKLTEGQWPCLNGSLPRKYVIIELQQLDLRFDLLFHTRKRHWLENIDFLIYLPAKSFESTSSWLENSKKYPNKWSERSHQFVVAGPKWALWVVFQLKKWRNFKGFLIRWVSMAVTRKLFRSAWRYCFFFWILGFALCVGWVWLKNTWTASRQHWRLN